FDKIDEELGELKAEIAARASIHGGTGSADKTPALNDPIEDELGDVLFTIANLARHLQIDPEAALRHSNRKFDMRFRAVERQLKKDGRRMAETPLDDLEALWQAAKGIATAGSETEEAV
ncbi:MAG: MazG nucleotide pyrophosphohydrolase domain-containing protein, partial [Geminicoccaceae bacterium]